MHDCKCARGTVLTPKILAATTSQGRDAQVKLASVRKHTRVRARLGLCVALSPQLCSDDSLSR